MELWRDDLPSTDNPQWQTKQRLIGEIINAYLSQEPDFSAQARFLYDQLRNKHPEVFLTEPGAKHIDWESLLNELADSSGFEGK